MSPLYLQQKILTMTPTEEEKQKIQEAQLANPDVPLGTAEQFLLTLSSISGLTARLQLWAFKFNYETLEKVSTAHGHLSEGNAAALCQCVGCCNVVSVIPFFRNVVLDTWKNVFDPRYQARCTMFYSVFSCITGAV